MVLIDGLTEYLGDLLTQLVHAIFYPINRLFGLVWDIMYYIYSAFASLFSSITGLYNTTVGFLTGFLDGVLPAVWIGLFMLAFGIVVILRIYHFVKDVSIFGWKI